MRLFDSVLVATVASQQTLDAVSSVDHYPNTVLYLEGAHQSFPSFSVDELFKTSVRFYSEKVAVSDDNKQYSYAELDAKVQSLSIGLATHGVEENSIVAVFWASKCGLLGINAIDISLKCNLFSH
ncbi:hypothetical protein AB835_06710 [Candidatus Endobugula sertula]|uniref:Uncharacterized protein n=1 Tax=Candidatus Endobugula sertula TaxID=62101 RepID=A0A1D2QQG4_9GAMM|nr:hypothetical protein AB835_06710 [Candidatus Endobugula sertula]